MEKRIAVFQSHEEAERADRAYYRSLTPERRLEILLELVENYFHVSATRLERVCRVTELGGR